MSEEAKTEAETSSAASSTATPASAPAAAAWKSRFPLARIKKIMQADQDVGKVAQVTPIIVSKALELFMQSIITESCKQTRLHNAKRVTVSHLKHAVQSVDQFDFLQEIVEKVPDAPAIKPERKSKRTRSNAASNENGGSNSGKRRKRPDSESTSSKQSAAEPVKEESAGSEEAAA
ncbi:DNA polymerase epsilon subunit Dpb3 [Schizosaccharomyces japonicus yFS275]|uniref:DNA polymerase epsilon subunit Dpb3 n=1 Tax=Schizosaccharomyces japonicus (strain yFS275 / FY16936) TaxID=402676 RepID=B6JX31_SCHJY|nr:DNA polymerase epsilon subunit Dpb3 [Schizosaccharomyces japonicus yFS275]EEB05932.1 DNA polymerase epsilon subunit Dpb3 [Schizosaccharomyces japonicus yFS275]